MKLKMFSVPYLVWMVIFILVPLLMVVYFAFTNDNGEFTIKHVSGKIYKKIRKNT